MNYIPLVKYLVPTKKETATKDLKKTSQIKHDSATCLLQEYAKRSEREDNFEFNCFAVDDPDAIRNTVGDRVAILGSEEIIYSTADCGLFASILMAYNYHWNLRTSPEDWWFCITRRVTIAIDQNSHKDSVRQMFVSHEGKKTLEVQVPTLSLRDVDYNWFFNEMSKAISENVKVPEYVDAMTADFSVTTSVQKIVSQIALMSSLQKYFDYTMYTMCGIPGVEMLGTEEDWKRLQSKLKVLRTLLEPIENDIGLRTEWWDLVETVFRKLLATYQGKPDKHFWSLIVSHEKAFMSGQKGGYTGWITQFMEGTKERLETYEFSSGLVTVPLTIEDLASGVKDTSALVAGMLGFTVHEESTSQVPSVRPFQGWCLLLPKESPFRPLDSFKQVKTGETETSDKMGPEEEREETSEDEDEDKAKDEEEKAQNGNNRKNETCSIS